MPPQACAAFGVTRAAGKDMEAEVTGFGIWSERVYDSGVESIAFSSSEAVLCTSKIFTPLCSNSWWKLPLA
jgi:hypothetical protein